MVRQIYPLVAEFKLNTDGCSKGNPRVGGGGGYLRIPMEDWFLHFFSFFLVQISSVQAKARAFSLAVKLCKDLGFSQFHVEVDSLMLVRIVQGKYRYTWSIQLQVDELTDLSCLFAFVTHYFRQANKPADVLATIGCSNDQDKGYLAEADLPCLVRGEIIVDILGFPSIRKKKC